MYPCKQLSANVVITQTVILIFTFQMNDILVNFDYGSIRGTVHQ